ncbi:MAG: hypothetical protein KAU31_01485, partial [Spirochaetaceae bacterium]|nr:hypothetical protein [Spirochaetaceae bacterium]
MTGSAPGILRPRGDSRSAWVATALTLGLVSAAVVALQIGLIRALSVAGYHHFTYLVISTALLGFGASGTLLSLVRRHALGRFHRWALATLVLFAVSTAWTYRIAASVPLDVQYLLYSFGQVGWLALYLLLLFVPFFAGGFFIGLVLTRFTEKVGALYALNLGASGFGAVAGVLLTFVVQPERLPGILAVCAAGVLLVWLFAFPPDRHASVWLVVVMVALAAVGAGLIFPPPEFMDKYKAQAHAIRLEEQGDARLLAEQIGPRGQIDLYDAPSIHYTLFASPLSPLPPDQLAVFVDGNLAGTIFQINSPEQAPILRSLPQSLPYRLLDRSEVLILGETSGVNVWLALEYGARSVTVVQSDPALVRLLLGEFAGLDGGVFDRPEVTVVTTEPRLFLEQTAERFDLVHVAVAEGMPASAGGLASLREDYLLTVEGVSLAIARLKPSGLVSVTRGLQSPPRDNVRLFALFREAIDGAGGNPAAQLLQARNYLAATTIASVGPIEDERLARFHEGTEELLMDGDYFPGITPDDLTSRNLPPPNPGVGSYYYQAAQAILGTTSDRADFLNQWVYDVRPPTDDRPYFHSFFRLNSLPLFLETYGDRWFQRVELGFAVVLVTLVLVLVLGVILVLVPVLVLGRRGRSPGLGAGVPAKRGRRFPLWAVMYFTLIGLGFMFLEMLFIQRLTRFLGDPIFATAAVLTSILVFAGAGSISQSRIRRTPIFRIVAGATTVAVLSLLYAVALDSILGLAVQAGVAARFVIAVVALVPISFFLGWQFPAGIAELDRVDDRLIPIAWASNGVASVVAAPLAVLVAMTGGFGLVAGIAGACYGVVAVVAVIARGPYGARQNT